MRSPVWLKLHDDTWGIKLFHDAARPGEIVTVERKDGQRADVRLTERVAGDQHWSLWRVTTELAVPVAPQRRVQPKRPVIRRAGAVLRLPVMTPEPPPHTDADAPPPSEGDD